jgi:hypothetical protein
MTNGAGSARLEVEMAFCTVVEWDQDLGELLRTVSGNDTQPSGCLVRIVGSSDKGTYAIEVWKSSDDARRFAEQTAPALAQSSLPPPTRVDGFEPFVALIRSEESG